MERAALARHFLGLGAEDRRLRFGVALPDQGVNDYVARIDFERDVVFGVFDHELRLAGAGHLARGDGFAELASRSCPTSAARVWARRSWRVPTCMHATGDCRRCSCIAWRKMAR